MLRFIEEPKKRLPVLGSYDLVVAGGGPAGIGAAVSAARKGARVILLEQTGCLGGMHTSGLVPCLAPYGNGDEPLQKGIAWEVLTRLRAVDGVGPNPQSIQWPRVDGEKLKVIYDQMATESGVEVLFFTLVSDVLTEKDRIKAVVIENKGGRQAVLGRVFVDATGDGDVAARAGAGFEIGNQKGQMQSTTLCFSVAGVDTAKYFNYFHNTFKINVNMTRWLQECEQKGLLPRLKNAEYRVLSHGELYPGIVGFNFGHVFGVNGTNPADLTRGMVTGRQIAQAFLEFARKSIPGMDQAHLMATGSLLGVRETRRIKGRYTMVLDDFKSSRHFADNIAIGDYPVDVHPATAARRDTERTDRDLQILVQPPGASFGVPFRTMLTPRFDNLVVAGRCTSSDRMVQGTVRVAPVCLAMGQAAGAAAVLALRRRIPVTKVKAADLQAELLKDGARLA